VFFTYPLTSLLIFIHQNLCFSQVLASGRGEAKGVLRAALVIACPAGTTRNLPDLDVFELSLFFIYEFDSKSSNETESITLTA